MLDKIHKIAEIIASIALVASLIFVGIQISQNTTAVRINTSQASVAMWQSMTQTFAASDNLAESWLRANNGSIQNLDADDIRLRFYLNDMMKVADYNYRLWLAGDLPDEDWLGIKGRLQLHFGALPVYAEMLSQPIFRNLFSPEFLELADAMIVQVNEQRAARQMLISPAAPDQP